RAKLVLTVLEASGERHPPEPDPQSPWHRPARQIPAENLDEQGLASVCSDPELSFVVSRTFLGPSPYSEIVPELGKSGLTLRLYRCADVRQAAGAIQTAPGSP